MKGDIVYSSQQEIKSNNRFLEIGIDLPRKIEDAKSIRWSLINDDKNEVTGQTELKWSRFHGKIENYDLLNLTHYIVLFPKNFGTKSEVIIPVSKNGDFDAVVPAYNYSILMVNSDGYAKTSMERWGSNFDLNKDKKITMKTGRIELYGVQAFIVKGGSSTIFLMFRPTSLSKMMKFDLDKNGVIDDKEKGIIMEALKSDHTAIAPDLQADEISIFVNGEKYAIAELTKIKETNIQNINQMQYILQIQPNKPLPRGSNNEIVVEVHDKQAHNSIDFGQASVGLQID